MAIDGAPAPRSPVYAPGSPAHTPASPGCASWGSLVHIPASSIPIPAGGFASTPFASLKQDIPTEQCCDLPDTSDEDGFIVCGNCGEVSQKDEIEDEPPFDDLPGGASSAFYASVPPQSYVPASPSYMNPGSLTYALRSSSLGCGISLDPISSTMFEELLSNVEDTGIAKGTQAELYATTPTIPAKRKNLTFLNPGSGHHKRAKSAPALISQMAPAATVKARPPVGLELDDLAKNTSAELYATTPTIPAKRKNITSLGPNSSYVKRPKSVPTSISQIAPPITVKAYSSPNLDIASKSVTQPTVPLSHNELLGYGTSSRPIDLTGEALVSDNAIHKKHVFLQTRQSFGLENSQYTVTLSNSDSEVQYVGTKPLFTTPTLTTDIPMESKAHRFPLQPYTSPHTSAEARGSASATTAAFAAPLEDGKFNAMPAKKKRGANRKRKAKQDKTVKFHLFMRLPSELRERVYSHLLVGDKLIVPLLCDCTTDSATGTYTKYHDANRSTHGAWTHDLKITFVSKRVREESLPIFYKHNVFSYGPDTLTYFEHLSHNGRFQMIHRVNIPINYHSEWVAAKALRCLHNNLHAQEEFEKKFENIPHGNRKISVLKSAPQYSAAGLPWMGIFFILRKLADNFTTSEATPDKNEYERELVLRVPRASMFEEYERLRWFPKVADGIGIKLKLVVGGMIDLGDGLLNVEWNQRYQKKDVTIKDTLGVKDSKEVLDKALSMYPNLLDLGMSASTSYYRINCGGNCEWYKIQGGLGEW